MIAWITREVGTGAWDDVEESEEWVKIDVRSLVDRKGNDPEVFSRRVHEALDILNRGSRVVICCDYGISRSNAFAAALIAARESCAFDEAVMRVVASTGGEGIQLDVLAVARQAAIGSGELLIKKSGGTLVTGGSGFLGRAVAKSLAADQPVRAPSRQDIDLTRDLVRLEILARQSGVDTVLHLAYPHVITTNASMGEALVMLKNVLDVCVANDLRLVYLSTAELYGGYQADHLLADANLAANPATTYGKSKALGEEMIRTTARQRGLRAAIVRCSPVFGPDSSRPKLLWSFIRSAREGAEIIYHRYENGPARLDLLFQDDAIAAIGAVVRSGYEGTLQIGSGRSISILDIAEAVIARAGMGTISSIPIRGYACNIVMDLTVAGRTLGWQPMIPFEEGLEWMMRRGQK